MAYVTVKPIRTVDDHTEALQRIECLLQAEPGSKEEDELDVLMNLVEVYERRLYADDDVPPAPSGVLQWEMDRRGWTQTQLAEALGCTQSQISDVLRGKRSISRKMAHALVNALDVPPAWLFRDASEERAA